MLPVKYSDAINDTSEDGTVVLCQESKTAKDLSRTHPADYANLCGRSSSITGDEVAPSARSLWCFRELRDLVFSRLRGLQKGKLERSAHMIRFRFPELAQII